MRWPSNFRKGSSTGTEPVAMMMCLAVRTLLAGPSAAVTSTLPPPRKLGRADDLFDLVFLQERGDAAGQGFDDFVLAGHHGLEVDARRCQP